MRSTFRGSFANSTRCRVVGNHYPEISDKAFKHFLKAAKIRLLDNDAKVLSLLNLVGRTDEANNEPTEFRVIFENYSLYRK